MKLNYRLLAGVALLIAITAACGKKYVKPNEVDPIGNYPGGQPPTATAQMNKLFKELRSTPERQCVTAGTLQVIQLKKGTILTFYPNSFKDKAGNIITSGTICLEVIEMYSPGDIIANRASTQTKDGILQSSGQLYIKAMKNDQEVFANRYGIAVKKIGTSGPMALYYGNNKNADSVVTWTIADTTLPGTTVDSAGNVIPILTPTPTIPVPPTPIQQAMYVFDSVTFFGYTNIDWSFNDPATHASIKLTVSNASAGASFAKLILHDYNAVFDLYYFKDFLCTGMLVSIIIVNVKDDGSIYYYEKKKIITTLDMSLICDLTPISLDQLKTKLSEL